MKRISNSQYFKATYAGIQDDFDQPYSSLDDCHCDDLRTKLEEADNLNQKLSRELYMYQSIRAESRGVYGYHLNGDNAPWDEFEVDEFIENQQQ